MRYLVVFILLPFITLAQTEKDWSNAGFGNPSIVDIGPDLYSTDQESKFTHYFDMSIVRFRGVEWTSQMIKERFKRVALVYSQCNVRLRRVNLIEVNPSNNLNFILTAGSNFVNLNRNRQGILSTKPHALSVLKVLREIPVINEPKMFYVSRESIYLNDRNASAFAIFNEGSQIKAEDEALDTMWVGSLERNMEWEKKHLKADMFPYIMEAHELGHILMKSSHVSVGFSSDSRYKPRNLMASAANRLGPNIIDEQCYRIKRHRYVHRL